MPKTTPASSSTSTGGSGFCCRKIASSPMANATGSTIGPLVTQRNPRMPSSPDGTFSRCTAKANSQVAMARSNPIAEPFAAERDRRRRRLRGRRARAAPPARR